MGFTRFARTDIFALRAAPMQVSFLGYPGTMGAAFIDYLIADRTLIPPESRQHFTEAIAYLPDSYQPNDERRQMSKRAFTRDELGLGHAEFVFCCFNNNYKIRPNIYDIWMRLLSKVPGSVLWLLEDNAIAAQNLRHHAEQCGLAPGRIVLAPRVAVDEHLARHRLADLFLDTLPCSAHTTASDALWAGLPVLTCMGTTFAGRVAGSLLDAVGLSDLITRSLEDYERMALKLATSPDMLSDIRGRLAQNRKTHPLFDTDLLRRHLELAYVTMWERYQRAEPAASFSVPRSQ
jgi:predicted O-linked N-acetylglucosamine transferase (SPINDLY family)